MQSTPPYAELACTSNFTFLTGASHPQELVARAAGLGYSAIAIADECSLAGVVRALEEAQRCAERGQPIHLIRKPILLPLTRRLPTMTKAT